MASSASQSRMRKPATPGSHGPGIPGRGPEATGRSARRRPFLVFRDKVQEELKLSDDQKQKLMETFPEHASGHHEILREDQGHEARGTGKGNPLPSPEAHEKLAAFLKETLKDEQLETAAATGAAARRTVRPGPARDQERAENHRRAKEAIHGRRSGICKRKSSL